MASEISGMIQELPSDQSIIESSDFRSRGFKKGGRVALVSYLIPSLCFIHISLTFLRSVSLRIS